MSDHCVFELEELVLQSGQTLPNAKLVYKTHGELNADKNNVVLYSCHFSGRHSDCEHFIGDGNVLDTSRYFIINTNLTGSGLTSSPSNTPAPNDKCRFPTISIYDNIQLQNQLLESLGIDRIALALGHSMGAVQTFHWAALFPDRVERIAPFCGSAKTSQHNVAFLQGMRAIINADANWKCGDYDSPPTEALRAVGRAWAPWGPGQHFYRDQIYKTLGFDTLESFLVGYWEKNFMGMDANNMLSQVESWIHADISANERYDGNFEAALGAIKARAIVMPSSTDPYFPPEDSAYEVEHMPNAELRPIPSKWGHWAGSGRNPDDNEFIAEALRELLAS